MRIGQLVELRMHCGQHLRMLMAEAGHGGTTARIKIGLAGGVEQVHAPAGDADWVVVMNLPVKALKQAA